MKLKSILLSFSPFFCIMICGYGVFAQETNTPELYLEPIFHVNYGDATADKPQSKSWTNQYGQWVIVGDGDGPKLLKKETSSWASQFEVNKAWHNLPSRADVYSTGDDAHIVLVGECVLDVVQIRYSRKSKQYEHQWKESLPIPQDCESLETATITRDSKNQFWVVADVNQRIMVWHSKNGRDWSEPFTLAQDINKDDISLIVSLKNQVSVIWSNQNSQSIIERIHIDGEEPNNWSEPIIVQQGDNNADDHLNATVFKNGEMALVTKNSVDQINQPQFVLRIRDKEGRWTNIPYENLTAQRSPSRPIINHVESGKIYEAHAVKNRENNLYIISVNEIVKKKDGWEFRELIQLKTKIKGKNGDVTSSKASFFPKEAKLIFFSDDLGNIYSFDLDSL
ncbi:hypothetical protein KO529_16910 [Arenibacter algicola]|uniref:hypothetical protein n=1 Tax=Arenibacter algicola TaxID=616991 RepID=UPI001C074BB6|nr:hypothetical protein [Arenibacter algicola]MBU2906480.1 hypothetical protein [Arenibacter algicola]